MEIASTPLPPGRRARRALYTVLLLLAAAPVAIFVAAGLSAGSIGLQSAGGPLIAFSAGVLSFLSPCVLPLVPIYVTHLAGIASYETRDNDALKPKHKGTLRHAIAFVFGLTLVFVALGASVGLLGFFLTEYKQELQRVAGMLMLLMGALVVPEPQQRSINRSAGALIAVTVAFVLVAKIANVTANHAILAPLGLGLLVLWARTSGFLRVSYLSRTFQFAPGTRATASYGRSALVGAAFATGWTPCVGPVLGGILTLAATSGTAWTGAYLLLAYSAGLGIPFLITGIAVDDATRVLHKMRSFMGVVELASAVVLVGLGILLLVGRLTALNQYFNFADFNQGL